jgi:hypothetical protein
VSEVRGCHASTEASDQHPPVSSRATTVVATVRGVRCAAMLLQHRWWRRLPWSTRSAMTPGALAQSVRRIGPGQQPALCPQTDSA